MQHLLLHKSQINKLIKLNIFEIRKYAILPINIAVAIELEAKELTVKANIVNIIDAIEFGTKLDLSIQLQIFFLLQKIENIKYISPKIPTTKVIYTRTNIELINPA